MRVLMLGAGIVGALAGLGALGYSYANWASGVGAVWLVPGSLWAVGGLILIGIASLIERLDALVEAPRLAAAPPVRAKLPVNPARTAEVAPPDLKADGEKEAGGKAAPLTKSGKEEKSIPPLSTPHGAAAGAAAVLADRAGAETPTRTLDFASAVESALNGGPAPPIEKPAAGAAGGSAPPVVAAPKPAAPAQEPPPILVRAPEPAANAAPPLPGLGRDDALVPPEGATPSGKPPVLKSGVIEGMAYTLYADGSVDAELPDGTRHFTTIADWRAHMRGESIG